MTVPKLSSDEQKMVEDNLRLVTAFLKSKSHWIPDLRESPEDLFQTLCEELCYSVRLLDPSKGRLSTIFYKRATNKLMQMYRLRFTDRHRCNYITTSLDQPVNPTALEPVLLIDLIPSPESLDIDDLVMYNQIVKDLDPDDPYVKLLTGELTQQEVSQILGVSQASVSRKLKKFRDSLIEKYNLREELV